MLFRSVHQGERTIWHEHLKSGRQVNTSGEHLPPELELLRVKNKTGERVIQLTYNLRIKVNVTKS